MKKRYLLYFSVLLMFLFLGFMIGCGGDGTGGINYQNLTVVPGILTPTPAGAAYGTVSGKVIDPLNNPLSNATVKVDGLSLTAVTNDKGEYTLWNVPGGKQKFIASKDGFIEAYNHGDVMPGQTSAVDIVLPPNSWKDPAVIQQVDDLGKQVGEYLDQQLEILGNEQQARESTIAWLKQQPFIQEVSLMSDGFTIRYKTNVGMVRYIFYDGLIKNSDNTAKSNSDIESLSFHQENLQVNLNSTSEDTDKALLIIPYRYQGDLFDGTGLRFLLYNWGYKYTLTYLYNAVGPNDTAWINKDLWQNGLDDGYELIIIEGHAGYDDDKGMLLRTGLSKDVWQDAIQEESNGNIIIDNKNVIAITPKFIRENYSSNAFASTKVIYLGTCNGLHDDRMSKEFLSKGVKMYYGWTGITTTTYNNKIAMDLIGSMLSGYTLDEAYVLSTGTQDPFSNSELKYDDYNQGNGNIKLRDCASPLTAPSNNASDYSCEWTSQCNYPTTDQPLIYLWVNFKNTGKCTWYRDGNYPVRLGTSNPNDRNSELNPSKPASAWISGNRPARLLQKYVNPGDVGTFVFFIGKSEIAKTSSFSVYKEYFRPVIENVTWMEPNYGVYWIITFSNAFNGIKYSNADDFSIPIDDGDGNVDVTVDKKGGK